MINVANLSCGYDDKDIINDISFSCDNGECLAVLGPNGSGKTTLFRALSGLIDYKGSIRIDDTELKSIKNQKDISTKIALMTQLSESYFSFSVYDTIAMGRYSKSGSFFSLSDKDKEIIEYYIEKLNLSEIREKSITELSGGQLQRVFLARAFIQEPQIILLDEPTNHLDIRYQLELIEHIKEWVKKENRCVIGVFHDINLSMAFSDKTILIDNGKITFSGNSRELIISETINKTYGINIREYMQKNLSLWNN
ncbi:MAG TPA: ABC transporter ATP-binding protein [Oscillospiraceae bacterium]|nr:ABC transporter ATP-binding protein [Oscillospiraceae bacterium]